MPRAPTAPAELAAHLDEVYPLGQPEPDPTQLRLAIAALASRLRP